MRTQTIDVKQCTGRILFRTIFRAGGKKILSKGHLITEEDARMLETAGLNEVWVTELEEGEVGEDEAALKVAGEIGCGALEVQLAPGGRANLVASEPCCVLVDDDVLKQINSTASVAIATATNFSYGRASQRVATVKSTPFAVANAQLETVLSIVKERGPILQARPIRKSTVAVLYTDARSSERSRELFEHIMHLRLQRFGTSASLVLASLEEESAVCRALQHLLRAKPACVLIASTTTPAGPGDVVARAMARAGCHIERFLAPVEPGNLLLLSYKDDIPVVAAPGCFRTAKPNVLDLLLAPLLARYRISGWEIACLGHGGLLA